MPEEIKTNENLIGFIKKSFNKELFEKINWQGTFLDYINLIAKQPQIVANSWTRLYNMIISKGSEDIVIDKKKIRKYHFFHQHPDFPVFGLEHQLEEFVDIIHAGALGYGPERRVLLLHGPVGSAKSTICTLLKRGLEEFSQTDEGALYTYSWDLSDTDLESVDGKESECPIHEEPLNLISIEARQDLLKTITKDEKITAHIFATLCPKCQYYYNYFLQKYDGDIEKVLERIKIKRFIFDEKTRKGIGTFQPKDEKNQDATELTGDINFRKLGQIGVDSDPRCFNFDGEFQVANRGFCEFIEVLKLTKEFLYDLLGASQEKQVKPKKFSQMSIDEVLLGHSVHGDTLIPHQFTGPSGVCLLNVLPIEQLVDLPTSKLKVFSVNIETKKVELTEVKSVFSHDFDGNWIKNTQNKDDVSTTPNHSVYNENYETFYPGDDKTSRILQVEIPEDLIGEKSMTARFRDFINNVSSKTTRERQVEIIASGKTKAWDIECIGNHNFIGGKGLFVLHNTNAVEMNKLKADKTMEALRDRTVKIDIPYLLTWDDEIKIYNHAYNSSSVRQHIAPHTLEIAALWSVVTRLHDPKDRSVSLVEKAKLYNKQLITGWTEDKVKELKEATTGEGMNGISARFIQNCVSNVLVNQRNCVNVFMVLKEFNQRLDHYSLINSEDDKKRYKDLIVEVQKEYDEIVKDEIQKALIGDEDAIKRLCTQYVDNVMAYVNKSKIENPITGKEEFPNERLMRSIEEKIDIGEQQVSEFRRSVVMHIGSLANQGKKFDWISNERLSKALKLKLFEDTKDTIKLAKLSEGANVVDSDIQKKIDALKTRLIEKYGYCEHCAADILQYASSIFARGDLIAS